jgi:hypothetical protein
LKREEVTGLERYFRRSFGASDLKLKPVPRKDDMLELYRGDEFLGLVYRLVEDGELSYELRVAILEMDLEEG